MIEFTFKEPAKERTYYLHEMKPGTVFKRDIKSDLVYMVLDVPMHKRGPTAVRLNSGELCELRSGMPVFPMVMTAQVSQANGDFIESKLLCAQKAVDESSMADDTSPMPPDRDDEGV